MSRRSPRSERTRSPRELLSVSLPSAFLSLFSVSPFLSFSLSSPFFLLSPSFLSSFLRFPFPFPFLSLDLFLFPLHAAARLPRKASARRARRASTATSRNLPLTVSYPVPLTLAYPLQFLILYTYFSCKDASHLPVTYPLELPIHYSCLSPLVTYRNCLKLYFCLTSCWKFSLAS